MKDASLYDERQLFELIGQNNHAAFTVLVDRHWSILLGQAMVYLKDMSRAQDLVQEVFLTIWKDRHKLTAIDAPESYLFIITRNKIVSELRKKLLASLSPAANQLYTDTAALPDDILNNKQLTEIIQSAIDQLPPQRKIIFELSKIDGLKYEEIAHRLGISRETVKVHMVKALAFIRQFLRGRIPFFTALSLFLYKIF